jgi:hypothetical protein
MFRLCWIDSYVGQPINDLYLFLLETVHSIYWYICCLKDNFFYWKGCTFTGFKNHEYLGEKKVYEGPAVWSDLAAFDLGEVNGFSSYYCDCDMNYITCIPEDSYALVLYCDASSAQVIIQSNFSKYHKEQP